MSSQNISAPEAATSKSAELNNRIEFITQTYGVSKTEAKEMDREAQQDEFDTWQWANGDP